MTRDFLSPRALPGSFSCRGQSSITDALFFLLVCSLLTALLFFFGTRYGESVNAQALYAYQNDFAKSTLKTLMYASVPRHAGEELSNPNTKEIDYLFPLLKEDIARNGRVETSRAPIRDNIEAILRPFVGTFDYMVYIFVPSQGYFPFMMLHRSVFSTAIRSEGQGFGKDYLTSSTRDELDFCFPTGVTPDHQGYCVNAAQQPVPSLTSKTDCEGASNIWRDISVVDDAEAISEFRKNIGRVFDSTSFMQVYLPSSTSPGAPVGNVGDAQTAIIELLLWNPGNIPTPLLSGPDSLNCYCDQVLLPAEGVWRDCSPADSDLPSLHT